MFFFCVLTCNCVVSLSCSKFSDSAWLYSIDDFFREVEVVAGDTAFGDDFVLGGDGVDLAEVREEASDDIGSSRIKVYSSVCFVLRKEYFAL